MSYYKNFRFVIGTPLWRVYLKRIYAASIADFAKLKFSPDFQNPNFTCLLCGVGNEVTADEFIQFVLSKNPQSKIWIIDLGEEQLKAVKQMISQKHPCADITVKQINALNLEELFEPHSLDWIETDGLFEFFDNISLAKLLVVWQRLLAKDGFITTRACSTTGFWDILADQLKVWFGRVCLGVTIYSHGNQTLRQLFNSAGFKFIEGPGVLLYRRYSLINLLESKLYLNQ